MSGTGVHSIPNPLCLDTHLLTLPCRWGLSQSFQVQWTSPSRPSFVGALSHLLLPFIRVRDLFRVKIDKIEENPVEGHTRVLSLLFRGKGVTLDHGTTTFTTLSLYTHRCDWQV